MHVPASRLFQVSGEPVVEGWSRIRGQQMLQLLLPLLGHLGGRLVPLRVQVYEPQGWACLERIGQAHHPLIAHLGQGNAYIT